MLKGESILCFAPDPWTDIWRNRHQIMSLLATQNKVLYIEPRPYLRDVLRQVARGRLAPSGRPRLYTTETGVHVFRPPRFAPLSGRRPLGAVTDALRAATLQRAMRDLGISKPIVWLFRPEMADIPGRYGERLLIYHIVDEYTGYAGLTQGQREAIARRERRLIAQADLVLVTSRALLERKGGINPNTHWVPNGVDWQRFSRVLDEETTEPEELADRPHPRICYVGAINDKIDTGLLRQVADVFYEGTLVLVGPETGHSAENRRDLQALRERPNVCLVGRVDVARVPRYMAACDVGLLPYRQNEWTRHIHPLKLYEYLACGLPVAATDIPALWDEQAFVHIAGDAGAFMAALRLALAEDEPVIRAARRERARANTWRQRVERISQLIEDTIHKESKAT